MDKLLDILRELHPEADVEAPGLITNGILDSFDIVALVGEIEDRFQVVLPASELTPENLDSAQALWERISVRL